MILRVAAKREFDADLATLWFNDIARRMEVDQAWNSFLLSFSLLAAWTHLFVAPFGGRAV